MISFKINEEFLIGLTRMVTQLFVSIVTEIVPEKEKINSETENTVP